MNPELGSNTTLAALLKPALRLALGALLAVGLLQWVVELTRQPIADARQRLLLQTLNELLPQAAESQLDDSLWLLAPNWLGSTRPLRVYRRAGSAAMVIEALANNGYAGDIRLLVGLGKPGVVSAVRVSEHRETPGLGDAIEVTKSDWILGFDGLTWPPPDAASWQLDKDRGQFDTIAGATITSRAVVDAVARVAQLHARHYAALTAAEPGANLQLDDRPAPLSQAKRGQ